MVLLLAFLIFGGCCGVPWGGGANAAVQAVESYYSLSWRASDGFVLSDWSGNLIRKVEFSASWAPWISPGLSTAIYTRSQESPRGLYLERNDRSQRLLDITIPWEQFDRSGPDVQWLQDDGSEALVLANWKIYWAELSSKPKVKVVAEGVRSMSVANGHLVYLALEDLHTLVLCELANTRCLEPRTFDIGMATEQVAMVGSGDQALLLTFLPETSHYEKVALFDLRSGSVQALEFPSELAWVVGVHPVPGTTTTILEEGGRTELLDGATQIRLYLWDYAKNHTTLFYEDCRGKVLFRHRL